MSPPGASSDYPGHLSRHLVAYATIALAMSNVLSEKLAAAWPKSPQELTLLGLNLVGALASTLIAYRTIPGGGGVPTPRPNPPST